MLIRLHFLPGPPVARDLAAALYEITSLWRHPVSILSFPFYVASDGIGQRSAYHPTRDEIRKGLIEIVDGHLGCISGLIHTPPGVHQSTFAIKYEEMRRAETTISPGNILRLVTDIDPREFLLGHALHHMSEVVIGMGVPMRDIITPSELSSFIMEFVIVLKCGCPIDRIVINAISLSFFIFCLYNWMEVGMNIYIDG